MKQVLRHWYLPKKGTITANVVRFRIAYESLLASRLTMLFLAIGLLRQVQVIKAVKMDAGNGGIACLATGTHGINSETRGKSCDKHSSKFGLW